MHSLLIMSTAGVGILALVLTGCVPNNATGSALTVTMTDDTCAVSANTAIAGSITFTVTNSGSDVNEFEILADDKLRILGEKENITPGQTIDYVAQLEPGNYFTACKFQHVGAPIGLAKFTVTGTAVAVNQDQQQQIDTAVGNYVSYIRSQVGELIPNVASFATAYMAGDDATARALFPKARVSFERIEPTAEAFGDLDPKIDFREVDAAADGLEWTGFHRIEKDLWPPAPDALNSDGTSAVLDWTPSTTEQRHKLGTGLINNVSALHDLVTAPDFTVTIADISNGAISLLDEVAARKISGEEDWWSHTDLWDFYANVQGAEVAFGTVKDIASGASGGPKLVASIEKELAALKTMLDKYGSLETGYVSYETVTDAQRKQLSDQVNALSEPLSRLTHAVLGIDG